MGERKYWNTRNYPEILPSFGDEKIKIQTTELTRKQSTEGYCIPPGGRNTQRTCDEGEQDAEFIDFNQDNSLTIT